uniref:DNA (cytosine-5-)-methyltransferase n=1 Tax=Trichuris muris TaxID=70415 RepID=A0A5S6R3L8_TRIMR
MYSSLHSCSTEFQLTKVWMVVKALANVEEISPIDLLIGGSPCNDKLRAGSAADSTVAVSDPDGTGILFFEYYRVLQNLLLINAKAKRNLFWLFENVASMRDCYKTVIDRFLGRPPALYDSRFFSAQNRARYFWGNIPGMYQANVAVSLAKAPILDDVLTPNCGRKSKMAKVRTITTRSNSLKQGRTFSLCPVEMDGRPDILWPTEIERLFGFPVHYTDVGGLPPSKRQKLIGQGWTVPVVKHIMRPLQNFFKRTS